MGNDIEVATRVLDDTIEVVPGQDEISIKLEKVGSVTGLVCLIAPGDRRFTDGEKNLVHSVTAQFEVACERLRLRYMEEQARIVGIIDVLGDGVLVLDERCQPSLANSAALDMFGHTSLQELAADARLAVLFRSIKAGSREVRQFSVSFLKPRRFNLAVIAAPLHARGETVAGYVISLSNVTSLKSEGRRRLEFVSVIANKLPAVIDEVFSMLKVEQHEVSLELEKQLREMRRQCWRLLSFSQMEAGPLRLDRLRIQVPDLIRDVIEQTDYIMEGQVRFDIRVDGEVPEIYADEDLLKILFNSLMENSIQALPEGGTVLVSIRDDVDTLEIKVEDEGPGVVALREDIIFDVSRQLVEFENMNVAEIGVGLPMAKHIVQAHGGRIWLFRNEETGRSGIGFTLRKWF